MIYVNHTGAQTELIFDGGSLALNSKGQIVEELNYFEEDFTVVSFNSEVASLNQEAETIIGEWQNEDNDKILDISAHTQIERIYNALILGIRDYFQKSGFTKATLGMSGGIDSAVVLALACEALGKDNVLPVLMPSQYSTGHSVDDSIEMVNTLGCKHEIIPIKGIFDSFQTTLSPQFKDLPFNLTEENMQARIRGVLLMAMSNKFGYILLNTSNKSENAVGYGTLYGDMCGGLSVIGDVYKMQVYALARFINRDKEIIPENIITKAPSAELRPDQKDSDSLPEYDVLDKVLYQYIELRKSSNEIIALGFDETLVKRILKLVNTNEYKRHQTPPILRVSPKAFGVGRRMPIVGKYLS
ncbi:Glutamine-dependent NAD(+) synthetase [compost metagenome]